MAFPAFHSWCSLNPELCVEKLIYQLPIMLLIASLLLLWAWWYEHKKSRITQGVTK